jgi:hypothetical protein
MIFFYAPLADACPRSIYADSPRSSMVATLARMALFGLFWLELFLCYGYGLGVLSVYYCSLFLGL